MNRAIGYVASAFLLGVMLIGCASNPTTPTETGFVINGTLRYNKAVTLPATSRVIVLYQVSSGSPDYSYVLASAPVDLSKNTFRIVLPATPPDSALNRTATVPTDSAYYRAGVAGIILVDDKGGEFKVGVMSTNLPISLMLGMVNNVGVMYRAGTDTVVGRRIPWMVKFPQGHSLGNGVIVSGGSDYFEPIPAASIELLVDPTPDPGTFVFPDWT